VGADADADADTENTDGDTEKTEKDEAAAKAEAAAKKKKPPPPPKPTIFKPLIEFTSEVEDLSDPTEEEFAAATGRIAALVAIETEKRDREAAYNDLESFIYKCKNDLEEHEGLKKVTNESQRELMSGNLSEAGLWLEDDGWEANTSTLTGRRTSLQDSLADAYGRAIEAERRPAAIRGLEDALKATSDLLERVQKLNKESVAKNTSQWISDEKYGGLEKVFNDTTEWFQKKKKAQKNTAATDAPKLKAEDLGKKTQKLNRETMYVAKTPKPRPPKKPKAKKNKTKASENVTIDVENATVIDEEEVAPDGAKADVDADAEPTTEAPPLDEPASADADADADAKDEL
jgi:hypoxia up-regulated 1